MRIIRKRTFETNSSSCHSLTMEYTPTPEDIEKAIAKIRDTQDSVKVTLKGYYNNPPAYSLEDKLSYIFTDFLQDISDELVCIEEVEEENNIYRNVDVMTAISLFKAGVGSRSHTNYRVLEKFKDNNPEFQKLWELVEEWTGLPIEIKVHNNGSVYVDHESVGLGRSLVKEWNVDKLKTFLFDSRNYFDLKAW